MTQTLKDELDRRFLEVESEDLYRIYLDPRYKAKYFSSWKIAEQIKLSIAIICSDMEFENRLATNEESVKKK